MDWEAEGLLEGCPDEAAREARRALLDRLEADGVPVEELRRAVLEDRLVLLPVERALTSQAGYTARDVARLTGLDLEYLAASRRALGLAVPDADERVYADEDLEAARLGARYREAGFPDDGALEVARVLGEGMARYAEAARTLVADTFSQPGLSEFDLSRRFEVAAQQLMPLAGAWLQAVFALHLRQVLRADAITEEQRRTGRLGDAQEAAVAFADLVGFTELGELVPSEELGSVAAELSRLAGAEVEPPVRLVKLIGDAVMLVAPEPAALVDAALRLVERADQQEALPALRAGVAFGEAVNRWGDWYGAPVNVASRLTARARPGTVLVTEAVREAAGGEDFEYSRAGRKRLKGVSSPVRAFRVRRRE
jgi:adenylate cyclase